MLLQGFEQNLVVHDRAVVQQVDEAVTVLLHFGQIAASLDDDRQGHQQEQSHQVQRAARGVRQLKQLAGRHV